MKKFLIILVVLALILVAVVAFRQAGEKPDPNPGVSADQPTGQPTEEPDVTPGTEPTDGPTSQPGTEPPTSEPVEEPTDEPGGESEPPVVRFAVLSGPTGVGAAKLLNDADKGAALNAYDYLIATENSELVAALTKGEVDIATVASNVALNLYNKTNGGVKIIALGTQGVLHILEGSGGTDIQSVEDLFGQTIYSPGQGANPEYILRYLLMQYGIDPDVDVNIESKDFYLYKDENGNVVAYGVIIPDIMVADARQDVTVTLTFADGTTKTVTDSIASYVARNNSEGIYGAIMDFSDAAYTYLHPEGA